VKRQRRKAKKSTKRQPATTAAPVVQTETLDRRSFLSKARNIALYTAVGGSVGWYLVSEVDAAICGGDLTRIGNGVPTVVQIHDPQCPQCVALQKEALEAASEFEDDELQFVVANIRSEKGRRLANEHRVGHVTLLLFDGNGKRRRTIVGPNASAYLERQFRSHVRQVTPQK